MAFLEEPFKKVLAETRKEIILVNFKNGKNA